jgi:hypothetical protein
VIPVIEPILQFQLRVTPLTLHYTNDVGDVPTGWLFAKDMQPSLESGDCDLRGDVICHAYKKDIEGFIQERLVIGEVPSAVLRQMIAGQRSIAYGHETKVRVPIDEVMAPLANDAIPCNSDV